MIPNMVELKVSKLQTSSTVFSQISSSLPTPQATMNAWLWVIKHSRPMPIHPTQRFLNTLESPCSQTGSCKQEQTSMLIRLQIGGQSLT